MCGHGMVSHNFARKMMDWVKEGRRDPKQAADLHGAVLLLRGVQSDSRRRAS